MLGEITAGYTMSFERESKQSASRLWRAITDSGEVAQWMEMPSARIDLRVGSRLRLGPFAARMAARIPRQGVPFSVYPSRTTTRTGGG